MNHEWRHIASRAGCVVGATASVSYGVRFETRFATSPSLAIGMGRWERCWGLSIHYHFIIRQVRREGEEGGRADLCGGLACRLPGGGLADREAARREELLRCALDGANTVAAMRICDKWCPQHAFALATGTSDSQSGWSCDRMLLPLLFLRKALGLPGWALTLPFDARMRASMGNVNARPLQRVSVAFGACDT